jgi:hypothetical protein
MGWKTGFEPATPGTTIQCSNQLSYIHHEGMGLGVGVGVHMSGVAVQIYKLFQYSCTTGA